MSFPRAPARWPLVVDVRRGSQHDGPGLRSVVFFKGCGLRCDFCQNPETQDPRPELVTAPARCVACGACARACPAPGARPAAPLTGPREACLRCGACVEACPGGARRWVGRAYAPEALAELLLEDRDFYRTSGGGVTFSGGECLLHPTYLGAVLDALATRAGPGGVDVAVQTGGHFAFAATASLLHRVQRIYFDLKLADPARHRRHAGRGNARILANLARVLALGVPVEVRIPLVPGVTDDEENLAALAAHLRALGIRRVTLLPYNPAGVLAAEGLGRPAPPLPARFQRPEELAPLYRRFAELLRG